MGLHLNHFRVTLRIYVGFGVLIALGMTLGLFGVWQQSKVAGQVDRLVTMFDGTASNLEIAQRLEALRRSALHYQQFADEASLNDFNEAHKGAVEQAEKLVRLAASAQDRQAYEALAAGLASFRGNFDELVKVAQASTIVNVSQAKIGGQLVAATGNVIKLAREGNDLATMLAARTLESALYELSLIHI